MTADQVIKHFGGDMQSALALGFSFASVQNWKRKGIPPKTQKFIEMKTNRKLKADAK